MNIMAENCMSEKDYEEKVYNKPKKCNCECMCKCCCHEGPEPGRALLKCGCGGAAPIPVVSLNILGTVQPLPLASVTIDASELKNPTTLLTFTCEITSVLDVSLRLNFLIKKSTKGGCCQYVCGTHSFSDVIELVGTQTFSFQVCECGGCDECVTYTVEYVPIDVILAAGAQISNATLTALAVENK